jgi:hypothetical protein
VVENIYDQSGNGWVPDVGQLPPGSDTGGIDPDELAEALTSTEGSSAIRSVMKRLDVVDDFGADPTATVNSTDAFQEFFSACFPGKRGFIPPGNYLITPDVLSISPASNIDIAGPWIETNGSYTTILTTDPATATPGGVPIDGPMLKIHNLTQTSGVGKFIRQGYIGGLRFVDATGDVAPNRCGLSLSGIEGWHFGQMYGAQLRGDVVRVPTRNFAGNPDPYHCLFNTFEGITGLTCQGWAINNMNSQGFAGNHLRSIKHANGGHGIIRSAAAGNTWHSLSAGACYDWAIQFYDSGGTIGREDFGYIEIDDCENGVWVDGAEYVTFHHMRIIHRFHNGIGFWPRTGIKFGGSGRNTRYITLEFENRLEAPPGGSTGPLGGAPTSDDFGTLIDYASEVQFNRVAADTFFLSNDGLGGFPTSKYYANLANSNLAVKLRVNGIPIIDQFPMPIASVYSNTSQTVPGSGLLGKISFPVELKDPLSLWTNDEFTVPGPGFLMCSAQICVTGMAANQRCRWGFVINRNSTIINHDQQERNLNANDLGNQSFLSNVTLAVAAGDKVYFGFDQNSGVTKAISAASSSAQATTRAFYRFLESSGAY